VYLVVSRCPRNPRRMGRAGACCHAVASRVGAQKARGNTCIEQKNVLRRELGSDARVHAAASRWSTGAAEVRAAGDLPAVAVACDGR
jgi:hypothetical protein